MLTVQAGEDPGGEEAGGHGEERRRGAVQDRAQLSRVQSRGHSWVLASTGSHNEVSPKFNLEPGDGYRQYRYKLLENGNLFPY